MEDVSNVLDFYTMKNDTLAIKSIFNIGQIHIILMIHHALFLV